MKHSKTFFFDFCGTLIKEQTHSQLKIYCLKNYHFLYFIKYLIPNRYKIQFDCIYLKFFKLNIIFANWLFHNTTTTISFKILRDYIYSDQDIAVITLADELVIKEFLHLHFPDNNIKFYGSKYNKLLTPVRKKEIIINSLKKSIFFTDSIIDLPAMTVASKVVYSEFSNKEMLDYSIAHNHTSVNEYI